MMCSRTQENKVTFAEGLVHYYLSAKSTIMHRCFFLAGLLATSTLFAQVTQPQPPVAHKSGGHVAITGATVWLNPEQKIENATLIIKEGKVVGCTKAGKVPAGAVEVSAFGKFLYPSFIELYGTDFGVKPVEKKQDRDRAPQPNTSKAGPYSWNEALRTEYQITTEFHWPEKDATALRKAGFGVVAAFKADGISRGSGAVYLLKSGPDHERVLRSSFGHFLSFKKGSSTQDYPQSLMGCIALLRQTYLDAAWYAKGGNKEEKNLSLDAWLGLASQPQIFEVGDKLELLRAARLGQEFGQKYIIKTQGDEYQRLEEVKATGATLIVPVNFPEAPAVDDPWLAQHTSYETLLHWELAPTNLAKLHAAGVPFAITSSGLKNREKLLSQLRVAIAQGVPENAVLDALTRTPARLAGMEQECGTLAVGQRANLLVMSKQIFAEGAEILENWVDGERFLFKDPALTTDSSLYGKYRLSLDGQTATLRLDGQKNTLRTATDTIERTVTLDWKSPVLQMRFSLDSTNTWLLVGSQQPDGFSGNALAPDGRWLTWSASRTDTIAPHKPKEDKKSSTELVKTAVPKPFKPYGFTEELKPTSFVVRGATVWTSEADGVLENTDVFVAGGKIKAIGKDLVVPQGVAVIDGKGKHLTAGIIDEHSHIAVSRGVNEGTQSSSSEVRIGDVVDSEDIDIYRQLAGGVTASHLLHGSANAIGGQTQLIKLRWGKAPEQLKMTPWPGFIKFALGENVKQSNWGDLAVTRFPQTRMGVEQVFEDYFWRARAYLAQQKKDKNFRRDLELEAIAEILNGERHITCHSYVQSEINMLMKVAERHRFKVNTFTHILEGYKLANQMAKHGAGGSTFSDWWAYKFEVYQAIPHNAALMAERGVTVAINSDDAEMARRLNQEAAKAVKYGGMSETEAWKTVTINPAKLLRIDGHTGSIKTGKDADLVLWSDHPLSVYAKAEKTWVDGTLYFDLERDAQLRDRIRAEKARLIQKALQANKKGERKPQPEREKKHYHCDTEEEEG